MTTGLSAAHRKADRAVFGALLLTCVSAGALAAIDTYTEHQTEAAEAAALAVAPPPAESAAMTYARGELCLAEAMYHEARSEGVEGQKAVAEVVMRRVQNRHYPNTVCGVVYEGTERGDNRCQFTFACDGSLDRPVEPRAWERTRRLAARIMTGTERLYGETENAIAYHAVSVLPKWANTMLRTRQIGNHVFYRFMPVTRASAVNEETAPRSGVMLPSGEIVPYGFSASDEIQPDIEVSRAMGDGA